MERATYSLPIVTRRALLRWSIALLLVVGTAASYGAAAQSLAELRALSCCTHDCEHSGRRPVDPSRCCGVAPAAGAVVSASVAAPSPAPTLVATLLAPPVTVAVPSLRIAASPDAAAARAAPVFLLTRSLRI